MRNLRSNLRRLAARGDYQRRTRISAARPQAPAGSAAPVTPDNGSTLTSTCPFAEQNGPKMAHSLFRRIASNVVSALL
jgi:hypothetical protein